MKEARGAADGARWARGTAVRRAGVRHTRSGCIWGLGVRQVQR